MKKSKFIWDASNMELVEGKLPTKENQLFKGVDTKGNKMEIVYNWFGADMSPYTCYWGWG